MFFIFWNKNKASDQTASTGVRTQTYLQVITYLKPRLFCQLNYTNLSKSELFKNILQDSKWDTYCILLPSQCVCLNVKIGPPLYVFFLNENKALICMSALGFEPRPSSRCINAT